MASVNLVMLVGNLSSDVVTRYTPNGEALATFSLATNTAHNDGQGRRIQYTTFHNIVARGHLQAFASGTLKKGMRAYVEGRIHTRKWTDKRTQQERSAVQIIADKLHDMPRPMPAAYWDDNEYRHYDGAEAADSTETTPPKATQNEYARAKG